MKEEMKADRELKKEEQKQKQEKNETFSTGEERETDKQNAQTEDAQAPAKLHGGGLALALPW